MHVRSRISSMWLGLPSLTWQGEVRVFVQAGAEALDEWLRTEGVKHIENVNQGLGAVPWCSSASETPLPATACRKGEGRP